jgi:hypothetical protein
MAAFLNHVSAFQEKKRNSAKAGEESALIDMQVIPA